ALRFGFTLVELLIIILIVALGLTLLTPVFSRTKPNSKAFQCFNNLRQLTVAWAAYAEDNSGSVVYNLGVDGIMSEISKSTYRNWANNDLDWTSTSMNTNLALLQKGLLSSYVRDNTAVYRCPADTYLSSLQRSLGWSTRARSYSMNGFFGPYSTTPDPGTSASGRNQFFPSYRQWLKLTQVANPTRNWVFIEEHPDSINDGYFLNAPGQSSFWGDIPASFHNVACTLSFPDGHAETHRWLSPKTSVPVSFNYSSPTLDPAGRTDYQWLMSRAAVTF
ncbi:MAG TPA: hypothetical protein VHI52_13815, partial [Verrucomicrobiae bacterium]|nr:hypothetical protein [Verrucomicrobiae bacterium]